MRCQTNGYRERGGCLRLLIALVLVGLCGPLQALIGGQPDAEGCFGSVVSLRTDPGQRCTATKIGVRRFVTAAHCVTDIPTGTLAGSFQPGAASWSAICRSRAGPSLPTGMESGVKPVGRWLA